VITFRLGDRVRYVYRNHGHPLYGAVGTVLAQGYGPGPRNVLVRLDNGQVVVAPWGNWRKVKEEQRCANCK